MPVRGVNDVIASACIARRFSAGSGLVARENVRLCLAVMEAQAA
jgi:hypothetical protein